MRVILTSPSCQISSFDLMCMHLCDCGARNTARVDCRVAAKVVWLQKRLCFTTGQTFAR